MNALQTIRSILGTHYSINDPKRMQSNNLLLTDKQRRRLSSLKSCVSNIAEEGFIGGEAGVMPEHLERESAWLQSLPRID